MTLSQRLVQQMESRRWPNRNALAACYAGVAAAVHHSLHPGKAIHVCASAGWHTLPPSHSTIQTASASEMPSAAPRRDEPRSDRQTAWDLGVILEEARESFADPEERHRSRWPERPRRHPRPE